MHRNVMEQARKGRKLLSSNRSMSMNEIEQLLNYAFDKMDKGYDTCSVLLDVVTEAFYFGAATGVRQGCKN